MTLPVSPFLELYLKATELAKIGCLQLKVTLKQLDRNLKRRGPGFIASEAQTGFVDETLFGLLRLKPK